ncbi:prfA [Symbiodinium natans]|uniref:PrfA protein n=1 Tax=Symbiodinium natans TaxID=878477 RepID=A0A812MB85_9DINO|nr:prfA [Symbiodinium natans]
MTSPAREKGAPSVEVLRQEILGLKTKLRDSLKAQEDLREQLVPIERLKLEWRNEKGLRERTEEQVRSLEAKIHQLTSKLADVSEELQEQKAETRKYENRCLEFEKVCAELGQQERGAQVQLFRAQEREQLSRVDAFNSTLARAKAEELCQDAAATAHSREQQLCALKADLQVLSGHAADVRDELFEKRVAVSSLGKEHAALKRDHAELRREFDSQQEALRQAMAELGALQECKARLELDLQSVRESREASVPHPWEALMSHTQPDKLERKLAPHTPRAPPLQLPIPHDSTLAFRNAMDDKDVPGLAKHLQWQMSRLKSRRDYPRCAAARQLRGRILGGEPGPLFSEEMES